ncbi:DUF192 domain-containing protein [Patescibacteria group bacterium]|nr:DUF192 domain-containing protein [Patescibacteria group bacterium]
MGKLSKRHLLIIALLVLGLSIIGVIWNRRTKDSIRGWGAACFNSRCFNVELAVSPLEQSRGLMFREYLGEDEGMLFVYSQDSIHSFWMKNTLIPLDIIWISEGKRVVYISESVQPCVTSICPIVRSDSKARYVMELNAGTVEKIGLEIGDTLTLEM